MIQDAVSYSAGKRRKRTCIGIIALCLCLLLVIIILIAIGILLLVVLIRVLLARRQFTLSGSLIDNSRRRQAQLSSIDYIIAVNTNPLHDNYWRIKSNISSDGKFKITVDKSNPWVFVFVDSTETGVDMIKAVLSLEELDSLLPTKSAGSGADLGDVDVDEYGNTTIDDDKYTACIDALGMDEATASSYGKTDNMMLRYVNPDMDGDGVLDLDQEDIPDVDLAIWIHYLYDDNVDYVDNYIKNQLFIPTDNIDLNVYNSHIKLRFLRIDSVNHRSSFVTQPDKFIVRWTDPGDVGHDRAECNKTFTGFNDRYESRISNQTGTASGDMIGLTVSFWRNMNILDLPQGTLTYELWLDQAEEDPDETIVLSNVETPNNVEQTDGFLFPWFKFVTDSNDLITGCIYQWKRYVASSSSFVDATAAEVEVILGNNVVQINYCTDSGDRNSVEWYSGINSYAASGVLGADKITGPSGIMGSGGTLTLTEIDYVYLSVDQLNGLVFHMQIENTDGFVRTNYF